MVFKKKKKDSKLLDYVNKKRLVVKLFFGFLCIVLGIILNYLKIGQSDFAGFSGVGSWLIYVGLISLILGVILQFRKKDRIVDERMISNSNKATRIVWVFIFLFCFAIMIIDGIKSIEISYYMFMSYFVCLLLIVYFISYKIIDRKN
jgi:L-asparagine transporter-like permease